MIKMHTRLGAPNHLRFLTQVSALPETAFQLLGYLVLIARVGPSRQYILSRCEGRAVINTSSQNSLDSIFYEHDMIILESTEVFPSPSTHVNLVNVPNSLLCSRDE